MELKVDKAGRIVLPKRIRERLHLRAGSQLSIEDGPDGIFLRPTVRRPSLVEENGLLVHMGEAPVHFDWSRVIDEERDARLQDLPGYEGLLREFQRLPSGSN